MTREGHSCWDGKDKVIEAIIDLWDIWLLWSCIIEGSGKISVPVEVASLDQLSGGWKLHTAFEIMGYSAVVFNGSMEQHVNSSCRFMTWTQKRLMYKIL